MSEEIIVSIDSREKYPIPFPATIRLDGHVLQVKPVVQKRLVGDYGLACDPQGCVIERKASQRELLQNLFSPDQTRALRAFKRLADNAKHPVLLIEMYPAEFFATRDLEPGFDPEDIVYRLHAVAARFGFSLFMAGRSTDRRILGKHLLHMMCAHALASGALILQTRSDRAK